MYVNEREVNRNILMGALSSYFHPKDDMICTLEKLFSMLVSTHLRVESIRALFRSPMERRLLMSLRD